MHRAGAGRTDLHQEDQALSMPVSSTAAPRRMAEHNFNQTIRIADRGYIIVHGEIAVSAASVDELKANDIVKRLYLGGAA